MTTPLYSLGAKLSVVCAVPGEASDYLQTAHHLPNHLLIVVGVLLVRHSNLSIFAKGNCRYATSHLPLWVTNEGREVNSRDIKAIYGVVSGDSILQDRRSEE